MKKPFLRFAVVLCISFVPWNAMAVDFDVETAAGLQNALDLAGQNNTDDTIIIREGIYSTADNGGSPFTYSDGANRALTVTGEGAGITILTGSDATRVMEIDTTVSPDDSGALITIEMLSIKSGYAETQSAGLYVRTVNADVVVRACSVFNNQGLRIGGLSASLSGSGDCVLRDSEFAGNRAGSPGASGADIDAVLGNVTVDRCIFTGNTGGLYAALSAASDNGDVAVRNGRFAGNQGNIGGGIFAISYTGAVDITSNTVIDNDADFYGGGVWAQASSGGMTLASNVIAGNRTPLNGAGAWLEIASYGSGAGVVNVTGNTIWGNEATGNNGGLYLELVRNDNTANLYNNIIRGNTAGGSHPDIYVNDDREADGTGAAVNFYNNDNTYFTVLDGDHLSQGSNYDVDPLFVDAGNWNFKILKSSQCVDRGTNAAPGLPLADFEGDYRIQNGDGVKPKVTDIGADERAPRYKKVKVLSPNGGETIPGGTERMVFWGEPGKAKRYKLLYSLNGGRRWKTIARRVRGNSYLWRAPAVVKTKSGGRLKVIAYGRSGRILSRDASNRNFTVQTSP